MIVLDISWIGPLAWIGCALLTAWIADRHGAHPVAYATVGLLFGPLGVLWALWRFSAWGSGTDDKADG